LPQNQHYKGEGRLIAECNKNNQLNFSNKITTAANAHLMEYLLDNWLKNSHITVGIINYILFWASLLVLPPYHKANLDQSPNIVLKKTNV